MSVQRRTRVVQGRKVVTKGRRRPAHAERQSRDLVDPTLDLSRCTFLTYPHAAQYLDGITVAALKMRVKRGTVPPWCWTKFGGSVRFIREALDQLLQKKERLELARKLSGVHNDTSVAALSAER